MQKVLIIGLGGFAGAVLRYSLSGFVQNATQNGSFPYSTLVINLLGCVIMGALSELVESFGFFSAEIRSFLFIGLLGAFTTFSTFGNESVNLLREGNHLLSFLNIGLHILLGLGAIGLGRLIVGLIWKVA
ncbi:MAG: fluoride efflux transporter CrcB [Anaerolineaceae bacterium]|nr:fluoride efflux transporter CrcB [Anaerolineaceae bacterium]